MILYRVWSLSHRAGRDRRVQRRSPWSKKGKAVFLELLGKSAARPGSDCSFAVPSSVPVVHTGPSLLHTAPHDLCMPNGDGRRLKKE